MSTPGKLGGAEKEGAARKGEDEQEKEKEKEKVRGKVGDLVDKEAEEREAVGCIFQCRICGTFLFEESDDCPLPSMQLGTQNHTLLLACPTCNEIASGAKYSLPPPQTSDSSASPLLYLFPCEAQTELGFFRAVTKSGPTLLPLAPNSSVDWSSDRRTAIEFDQRCESGFKLKRQNDEGAQASHPRLSDFCLGGGQTSGLQAERDRLGMSGQEFAELQAYLREIGSSSVAATRLMNVLKGGAQDSALEAAFPLRLPLDRDVLRKAIEAVRNSEEAGLDT